MTDPERDIASNRDIVFNYSKNYPASHLRKISKELLLGMGNTQHHLKFLENKNVVRSRKLRTYEVYYNVSIVEGRRCLYLLFFDKRHPEPYYITSWKHLA